MNSFYSKVKRNICATLTSKSGTLLMAVALILQVPASAQTTGLTFTDHTLHSGTAGANGAVYRFANAAPGIDVLVEIKSRSGSNVVLKDIDLTTCGLNTSFQPQLERSGNVVGIDEWWMEFEFRFVKAGTQLDANLQKLAITALDVDGDGLTVEEYVEFYKAKSCTLASPSNIQAIPLNGNNETGTGDKNYRFEGELPRTAGIDIVNTAIMGYAKYENMNRIKVRIGGESLGLGIATETIRHYSLWFTSYQQQSTLPVKLTSFDAALINKKIALTWTTAQEKDASHFVIERSTNGIDFTDAGIIFTEGNSETSRSYSFKDPISTSGNGILYYRLKIVDLDGQAQRSAIRIIKLGQSDGKLELQAFPNPVVNELRITIPEGWQGKQVIYEVYTQDGQLLKRFLNKSATQTETISMQLYQPGTYIVKALNNNEMASQRIIKRR